MWYYYLTKKHYTKNICTVQKDDHVFTLNPQGLFSDYVEICIATVGKAVSGVLINGTVVKVPLYPFQQPLGPEYFLQVLYF